MASIIDSAVVFVALCVALSLVTARIMWMHRLNPIFIGVIVWAPALVMATLPHEFLSPLYDHLNREIGSTTLVALIASLTFFSAGVLCSTAVVGKDGWDRILKQNTIQTDDCKLLALYCVGLTVFLYSYLQSGLVDLANLDPEDIASSRLRLHLGPLSFAVFFLDIASIVFFAKMMETRRFIYLLPIAISILCEMATLQKSRVMFQVIAVLYLFLLHPAAARDIAFGTPKRKIITGAVALLCLLALFAMNALRGIGVISLTTFESPWLEQFYIYSGATAILNLSSAIQGHVPSDPPTLGLVLARPISWHLANRDLLNPTKYFEGINAATYLIYPWGDFRWFGFVYTPFLTGLLITIYLWLSLRKTVVGIVLGAIGFEAIVFSVNTDVIFDPTTAILILVAMLVQLLVARRRALPSKHANPSQAAADHN